MIPAIDISDVNRVEVIDDTGRAYTKYSVEDVVLALQDNGQTLKLFVSLSGARR